MLNDPTHNALKSMKNWQTFWFPMCWFFLDISIHAMASKRNRGLWSCLRDCKMDLFWHLSEPAIVAQLIPSKFVWTNPLSQLESWKKGPKTRVSSLVEIFTANPETNKSTWIFIHRGRKSSPDPLPAIISNITDLPKRQPAFFGATHPSPRSSIIPILSCCHLQRLGLSVVVWITVTSTCCGWPNASRIENSQLAAVKVGKT